MSWTYSYAIYKKINERNGTKRNEFGNQISEAKRSDLIGKEIELSEVTGVNEIDGGGADILVGCIFISFFVLLLLKEILFQTERSDSLIYFKTQITAAAY